ncbi:hypothetical protein Q671_12560 [Halomonas sp. PBN3]|nr:hypothetical protein Q671_12560 [Halomonas sp. PBN3]
MLLDDQHFSIVDVIQTQDFILDVKIQLAREKATQILMDKIVHGISGCVLLQVLAQQSAALLLVSGRRGSQPFSEGGDAIGEAQRRHDDLFSLLEALLLPGGTLARLVRVRPIFELQHQVGALQAHRLVVMDDEEALGALLHIVMLTFGGVHHTAVHLERGIHRIEAQATLCGGAM